MPLSGRRHGLRAAARPRVMSPWGCTHIGIEARGCSSHRIESGCATMLGTWVSLSMSGTGTGTPCGCDVGRIGDDGMRQRHADFTNACLLLFFLRLQSQIKLELKQYYGQQQLGQT